MVRVEGSGFRLWNFEFSFYGKGLTQRYHKSSVLFPPPTIAAYSRGKVTKLLAAAAVGTSSTITTTNDDC